MLVARHVTDQLQNILNGPNYLKVQGRGRKKGSPARSRTSRKVLGGRGLFGCHGVDGKGVLAGKLAYPAIGGQHRFYLRGQLQDWKAGIRSNSPDRIMNRIASALGDADIEALADYLSGL